MYKLPGISDPMYILPGISDPVPAVVLRFGARQAGFVPSPVRKPEEKNVRRTVFLSGLYGHAGHSLPDASVCAFLKLQGSLLKSPFSLSAIFAAFRI